MMTSIEIFRSFSDLPLRLREAWETHPSLTFDQTPAWYASLYELVLATDYELRLIAVTDDKAGRYLGVLPLMISRKTAAAPGLHVLRSLTNYYSSIFEPIVFDAANVAAVCRSLADGLSGVGRDGRYLVLDPLPFDGCAFREMYSALEAQGYLVVPHRRFTNWFHRTEGQSFDEYLASREGSVRNTYKRKEKKLRKSGYDLEVITAPDGVDAAIDDYESVYAQSWKGRESHPGFIRSLCKIAADHGWLRLGILRTQGQPVAAQIWFVKDGIASIYKLAYDEAHKALSAGTVLTMALVRHALDRDKVRIIDYLTGDDAYKSQYMSESREMGSIVAYRRGSLASIRGRLSVLKSQFRRFQPK